MDGLTSRRFKHNLPVCLLACLSGGFLCLPLRAQEPQTTQEAQQTTPAGAPKPDMPAAKDREVSWRTLPRNFLQDQKEIWLFPTQLAKGRHWLPTVGVVGATAILIAADPTTRRTSGVPEASKDSTTFSPAESPEQELRWFRWHSWLEDTSERIPMRRRRRYLPARPTQTAR